jgi:hypothetical protein
VIDAIEDRAVHVATGAEVQNQIDMVWVDEVAVEGKKTRHRRKTAPTSL